MEALMMESEISSIQLQLRTVSEKFDKAIAADIEDDAKRYYKEIKSLRERLRELNNHNGG